MEKMSNIVLNWNPRENKGPKERPFDNCGGKGMLKNIVEKCVCALCSGKGCGETLYNSCAYGGGPSLRRLCFRAAVLRSVACRFLGEMAAVFEGMPHDCIMTAAKVAWAKAGPGAVDAWAAPAI